MVMIYSNSGNRYDYIYRYIHILKEIANTVHQIFSSVSQNLRKRENQYSLTFFVLESHLFAIIKVNYSKQYRI